MRSRGRRRKFGIEEFFNSFDLERVSLGGAIFDRKKLDWLNGRYIREDLKVDDLLDEMRKWQLNDGFLRDTLPLMQERMDTLGDYMGKCAFFFMRDLSYEPEELVPKKRTPEEVVQVLQTAIWSLDEIEEWNRAAIENALGGVGQYWQWPIPRRHRPALRFHHGAASGAAAVRIYGAPEGGPDSRPVAGRYRTVGGVVQEESQPAGEAVASRPVGS